MEAVLTKQICGITQFETLSNELIMELFEYYDAYSMFHSFSSLNSRLDQILFRCQLHVDLDAIKPYEFLSFFNNVLSKINRKNILSFRASNTGQVSVIALDQSLHYFTYIRSIHLKSIQTSIIRTMVEHLHFSRLERVIFEGCRYDCKDNWSFSRHFIDPDRYLLLRTYKDNFSDIEKGECLLSIEHMTIYEYTDPHDFFNFIQRCPKLKYMKTILDFKDGYSQPIAVSPLSCNNYLTHLHLIMISCSEMKTINYLLACIPQVRRLKLISVGRSPPQLIDPMF